MKYENEQICPNCHRRHPKPFFGFWCKMKTAKELMAMTKAELRVSEIMQKVREEQL